MTTKEKKIITKISKSFAYAFLKNIGEIAGSGWLIVDPLSGYLNFLGFENELSQIHKDEAKPAILILRFKDGTQFIPAGSDLSIVGAEDWMWVDK